MLCSYMWPVTTELDSIALSYVETVRGSWGKLSGNSLKKGQEYRQEEEVPGFLVSNAEVFMVSPSAISSFFDLILIILITADIHCGSSSRWTKSGLIRHIYRKKRAQY